MKLTNHIVRLTASIGFQPPHYQQQFRKIGFRILLLLLAAVGIVLTGLNHFNPGVEAKWMPHPLPTDLLLTKQVLGMRPLGGYKPGHRIVYQLEVSNALKCLRSDGVILECSAATDVTVKDVLPDGLTFVGANPSGAYNPATGIWSVPKISAGLSQVLQITATIDGNAAGAVSNYAQVWSATPVEDPDSTPGNDSKDEDDDASVTINVMTAKASLAGNVYVDANDNGVREQGEDGIGGVTIALKGTDNQGASVSLGTTTQSNGSYIFTDLMPGAYRVIETQPDSHLDGKDSAGSAGGTLANDQIGNINLGAGVAAVNYNFGERELAGVVDLAIAKSHGANFTAGSNGVYTIAVKNAGNTTVKDEILVTDYLPAGMTFVSGTGNGWTCGAEEDRKVVCGRWTPLEPGASTTITLTVSLASRMLSQVVNMAIVSTPGDGNSSNDKANDTTSVNTAPAPPNTSGTCDPDTGSVLLFPIYTSDANNGVRENTRITLTNTNQNSGVSVHLFFVDGATCATSDGILCLTQNQTASFLMSDMDPGTTGYIVAVAVNDQGCPVSFNHLIGQADVRFASGQMGALAAETFPALYAGTLPGCDGNSSSAVIGLDGANYAQPGSQLAIPVIPSLADGNKPLIALVRTGGNLMTGASPIGALFGVLYNDQENSFSFSISSTSCQLKQALAEDFPRTAPRIPQIIPAGRTGWMRIGPMAGYGVAGVFFNNNNTNQGSIGSAFNGGIRMPKLRCGVDSYTIPVFPPSC